MYESIGVGLAKAIVLLIALSVLFIFAFILTIGTVILHKKKSSWKYPIGALALLFWIIFQIVLIWH